MSDELESMQHVGHIAGGGGLGAILVGGLMRWLYGRDAARKEEKAAAEAIKAREEFIELRSDVRHMMTMLAEHRKAFEDVVETKSAVKALHKRHDDLERRIERLEKLDIHIK